MRSEAKFSFTYESSQEAEAVVSAVSPDNIQAPLGLDVKTIRRNCTLLAIIRCRKSLETFIATLDDLLAYISIAEKTFKAVNR